PHGSITPINPNTFIPGPGASPLAALRLSQLALLNNAALMGANPYVPAIATYGPSPLVNPYLTASYGGNGGYPGGYGSGYSYPPPNAYTPSDGSNNAAKYATN